ncbi:MAG: hypothetical protein QM783_19110 [Phycisphaerales bacterium]
MDEPGPIVRLLRRIAADAPVWIVVASIVFLIVVNLRHVKPGP